MIHVVYCFDRAYQQHFGASATSLLLNFRGPGSDLVLHVLTDEVDAPFQGQLARLTDTFRARIEVHQVPAGDVQQVANLTLNHRGQTHLSAAAYFRVLLPHILPGDLDRVLYLDSDTIVLSDIRPLFEMDLQHATLAAALDMGSVEMAAERGLARYLNTGVMLMNLSRWRQDRLTERCLDFAAQNPGKISFGDQCAINHVCGDSAQVLDRRWNRFVLASTPMDNAADAGVLHFITPDKPWQSWYENDLGQLYWRYLDVSPWSGAKPVAPSTTLQARRLARLRFRQGKAREAVTLYESILSRKARP